MHPIKQKKNAQKWMSNKHQVCACMYLCLCACMCVCREVFFYGIYIKWIQTDLFAATSPPSCLLEKSWRSFWNKQEQPSRAKQDPKQNVLRFPHTKHQYIYMTCAAVYTPVFHLEVSKHTLYFCPSPFFFFFLTSLLIFEATFCWW